MVTNHDHHHHRLNGLEIIVDCHLKTEKYHPHLLNEELHEERDQTFVVPGRLRFCDPLINVESNTVVKSPFIELDGHWTKILPKSISPVSTRSEIINSSCLFSLIYIHSENDLEQIRRGDSALCYCE